MKESTRRWIAALEKHMRFCIDPKVPSHAAMIREIEAPVYEAPARCPECEHNHLDRRPGGRCCESLGGLESCQCTGGTGTKGTP